MRIGILTLHRANNYGAALQCFALQETLVALGYEVYVIERRGEERKGSRDYEGRRSNGRGCRPYPTLPFRRVSFPLYRV